MCVDPETNLPGTIPPNDHEKNLMHFFYGFFDYVKERHTPIDFFSWHSYADVSRVAVMDEWLHGELERLGFGGLETHLNEWDPYAKEFGTAHHSAEVAAMMLALQHGHADICCIYDMKTSHAPYCPLFNPITSKPIHGYYSMVAFNTLYQLGQQVETVCDTEELYVLAASNGKKNAMMISNLSGAWQELNIEGVDLSEARCYIIDNERLLSWAPGNTKWLNNNSVLLIEW
jgi:hypothetical protein